MVRALFLTSLTIGASSLAWAGITAYGLMGAVAEASGNAGAFAAFVSFGAGIIGVTLSGAFGLLGGSVKYLYPEKLPTGAVYSYWGPALLAAPAFAVLMAAGLKVAQ